MIPKNGVAIISQIVAYICGFLKSDWNWNTACLTKHWFKSISWRNCKKVLFEAFFQSYIEKKVLSTKSCENEVCWKSSGVYYVHWYTVIFKCIKSWTRLTYTFCFNEWLQELLENLRRGFTTTCFQSILQVFKLWFLARMNYTVHFIKFQMDVHYKSIDTG